MKHAYKGQAGSIVLAVILVVSFIVLGNQAAGLFRQNSSKHIVIERRHLQAYYAAKAGINEALGTRMVPRTNYLSLVDPQNSFYRTSGYIRSNPVLPRSATNGIYRYFILGGDPGRQLGNGQFYGGAIDVVSKNVQPFYIISQGTVCVNAQNALVSGIQYNKSTNRPQCPANSDLISMTLTTSVDLSSSTGLQYDLVSKYQPVPNPANIQLPSRVELETGGFAQNINFETVWASRNPAIPRLVVIQNVKSLQDPSGSTDCNKGLDRSSKNKCIYMQAITGTTTTINSGNFQVAPGDTFRIYFNQPIDYRTLYTGAQSQASDFDQLKQRCINDLSFCNVQIRENTVNGLLLTSPATIIPNLPSSSSFLVFPPVKQSDGFSNGNYVLSIQNQVKTFKGTASNTYNIAFEVP
jgi:hypothetical protein